MNKLLLNFLSIVISKRKLSNKRWRRYFSGVIGPPGIEPIGDIELPNQKGKYPCSTNQI